MASKVGTGTCPARLDFDRVARYNRSMVEVRLEISETGRQRDREPVCLLEGTAREVRRWATGFLMTDWQDGRSRARAWLNGQRFKPSTGDIAEVQAEIDAVLEVEAARNGQTDAPAPEPNTPAPRTFADRLRAMRG